jgi:phage repressor protein C with HTH and peptisase S24 domain
MPSIDDKLMEVHFSSISERVVDIGAHRPRRGEYCVLMAQLPGQHKEAIGVLLLDPEHDSLYVQLRRDWRSIAGQDDVEVLEALGSDLELKAGEMGGEAVLAHLESQASWTVQLSARNDVSVTDFERTLRRLYREHVPATVQPFRTHLPLYSLEVAAGPFRSNADDISAGDWLETPTGLEIDENMFIATIRGRSMEPRIPDGSLCVFRYNVIGSRNNRLVLVRNNDLGDENRFSVKRYHSEKDARDESFVHTRIWLESLNPEFPSWDLDPNEEKYQILAEFVQVIELGESSSAGTAHTSA